MVETRFSLPYLDQYYTRKGVVPPEVQEYVMAALAAMQALELGTLVAETYGVQANHDGTHEGGTDDTAAFNDFIQAIFNTAMPGEFSGGVRIDSPTTIAVDSITKRFTLRGKGPQASYLYLTADTNGKPSVPYFLTFDERFGLWTGDQNRYYTVKPGESVATSPPPTQLFNTLTLENFSIFGRGTDVNGVAVKAQRGIAFVGRHDLVHIERVHLFNIPGTAVYFGHPNPATDLTSGAANHPAIVGDGAVRESVIKDLILYRCGSPTEPAMVIGGHNDSFAANFLSFYNLEVSLSRGVGLHILNTTTANTNHCLYFYSLKIHGTGDTLAEGAVNFNAQPGPASGIGLIVEGSSYAGIDFYSLDINQCATHPGEYALEFRKNASNGFPSKVKVHSMCILTAKNGIKIAGGNDIDITLTDWAGVDGDLVTIGDNVSSAPTITGPIKLDFPLGEVEAVITCDPRCSQHVILKNSKMPPAPAAWSKYWGAASQASYSVESNANVSILQVAPLTEANKTTYLYLRIPFLATSAAAGLRYTVISSTATGAISLTERVQLPGAADFGAPTALAALPAARNIGLVNAGFGVIELSGIVAIGPAGGNIQVRVAQVVTDATKPITVFPGVVIETKTLA